MQMILLATRIGEIINIRLYRYFLSYPINLRGSKENTVSYVTNYDPNVQCFMLMLVPGS
jgi:hypothetical protein